MLTTAPAAAPSTGARVQPAEASKRDGRVDVLRALCIVSMTAGHLAAGTLVDKASHPLVWVDGAAGFVACSGLVLGRVQRGVVERHGPVEAHRRLLRRAGMLWTVHVGLLVAALTARQVTGAPAFLPTVSQLGGLGHALVGVVTLQVQPDYLNVLPLYVLLLVAANAAVALLRARRTGLALVLTFAVWAYAQLTTHLDGAPQLWQADTTFRVGAWQLLFIGGLIAGWHWDVLHAWCHDHARVLAPAAIGGTVGLGLLGQAVRAGLAPVWLEGDFEKYRLRPGAVVFTLVAAVALYWLAGRLPQRRLWHGLAALGSRSLDCFIALSAAQLLVFCLRPPTRTPLEGAVEIAGVLALDAAVILWRRRRAARPQASAPAPLALGPAPALLAASR